MRHVQHKKEAFWFYRFLSIFYDKYVNPFFWTERMREEALDLADLDGRDLSVIDVGSGTGFTTQGIVNRVAPAKVTCIDQSPHQMRYARRKPALRECRFQLGDAEELPALEGAFDRYVSAGSIEYWPEPQRGIAEAFRVLKPGGKALMIGPLRPVNRLGRWLANTWMLFPEESEYIQWFEKAGFMDIEKRYVQPDWVLKEKYGIALVGTKPADGGTPLHLPEKKQESVQESMSILRRLKFTFRLLIGNLAGFGFIPMAILAILLKPLRMRWHKQVNAAAQGPSDPLTRQQKAALGITVLAVTALILWGIT